MRYAIILLWVILFFNNAYCQKVLWANKVLEKSSEAADEYYSPKNRAIQILGKPSILPQAVSSACSWHPMGTSFGEDYIKVGFENAIKVRQIIIGETVNPGSIARVFGYSVSGEEILLYENPLNQAKPRPGITNLIIPETAQAINAIKLLLVHSLSKGSKEIDAIGISSSDEPFVALINKAENIPDDIVKENLGGNVNSKFGEVAPIVSPDGKYLFFTRLNHPSNIYTKDKNDKNLAIAQDVWMTKIQKNGNWEPAVNLGEPINNIYDNAAAAISADGKSLFLLNVYLPNGKLSAGLSKSTKRKNGWDKPKAIQIDDFQALEVYNEQLKTTKINIEFSISSDEKFLVMAVRRAESLGDKDLYVSFKRSDGNYSKPINLGPTINTAGNEGSPFLAADNKTLYFNSNGHPGYGDADLFMTTRLDDSWKNWTEPVNLGNKINSPEFDGYITIPASGEYAYFSSFKNSIGSDDIFRVKLFPSIKPEIMALYDFKFKDSNISKFLKPEISLEKELKAGESEELRKVAWNYDEDAEEFKTILLAGNKYKLNAKENGYNDFNAEIDLSNEKAYKEFKITYDLFSSETKAPSKGERLILKNLYFDQSMAVIREESYPELEKIKKWMTQNPKMEILLEGHTDNVGDTQKNIKLAEDRVVAVKNYLTKDGSIDAKRIEVKSWGPYKPITYNPSEEERKKNRRVEFTIIKM